MFNIISENIVDVIYGKNLVICGYFLSYNIPIPDFNLLFYMEKIYKYIAVRGIALHTRLCVNVYDCITPPHIYIQPKNPPVFVQIIYL